MCMYVCMYIYILNGHIMGSQLLRRVVQPMLLSGTFAIKGPALQESPVNLRYLWILSFTLDLASIKPVIWLVHWSDFPE